MEAELVGAIWAVMGTVIAGLLAIVVAQVRRNGKNGANPSVGAHLVRLEALSEQQVVGLGELRTTLNAIQLTLAAMETTVGACGAVQDFRRREG